MVESVTFSPVKARAGDQVRAIAKVSLLEPMRKDCEYVKCWGHLVLPNGGEVYLGTSECTIKQADPLNLEVTMQENLTAMDPEGYHRFRGLSLQASCHDYAQFYEGPRSRFLVVE